MSRVGQKIKTKNGNTGEILGRFPIKKGTILRINSKGEVIRYLTKQEMNKRSNAAKKGAATRDRKKLQNDPEWQPSGIDGLPKKKTSKSKKVETKKVPCRPKDAVYQSGVNKGKRKKGYSFTNGKCFKIVKK